MSEATLIDSSAWIEYLRDTGSASCERVDDLLEAELPIATTDVVIYELLAGARHTLERRRLWGLLNRCRIFPVRPLFDYEEAALLYARCRAAGVTPRAMGDCLIATVAIREDAPLLHADADFDAIARVAPLRLM